MRHDRILGGAVSGLILACVVLSSGCTHNYYYGYNNPCGPMPTSIVPGVVTSTRSVCDAPTQVLGGSTIVGTAPFRSYPGAYTAPPRAWS